ncbi:MAG TPA: hypothetical protein VGI81_26710 [Tepidisphaeraceae bacterium]|jgi:hypothetical protein
MPLLNAHHADMSVLDQEYLEATLDVVWAAIGNGRYAVGLLDTEIPPTFIYVFDEMSGTPQELSLVGHISGLPIMEGLDLRKLQVIHAKPPVRYMALRDGKVAPGFFSPKVYTFFRWRDEVRTADHVDFDPSYDAVSREVNQKRIGTVIEIPTPPDARVREPF